MHASTPLDLGLMSGTRPACQRVIVKVLMRSLVLVVGSILLVVSLVVPDPASARVQEEPMVDRETMRCDLQVQNLVAYPGSASTSRLFQPWLTCQLD